MVLVKKYIGRAARTVINWNSESSSGTMKIPWTSILNSCMGLPVCPSFFLFDSQLKIFWITP